MNNFINVFLENKMFFLSLLKEHIIISFIAIISAIILGVTIGITISEYKKLANIILNVVNILYTIPSIALLGFLISFTGIGNTTAIISLTVYALLPIVRSTYIGLTTINPLIIEAAEGMGSTKTQILHKIKLPLAYPIIMSGIRNMTTMTIALAGIASFIGAGGLGVAIYRGITTNNSNLTFLGSLLIAILALLCDFILSIIEKRSNSHKKLSKKTKKLLYSFLSIIIIAISIFFLVPKEKEINIATKPVTEGYILGEIIGQLIENKTNLKVKYTHGVGGGTSNIHPAITKGDFDIYPEYTGTIWQIILKNNDNYDESKFSTLTTEYKNQYNLIWANSFGFNDTYSLAVRKDLAEQYNLKTFSDLQKISNNLVFGAEYDFYEREDGFKKLTKTYNLNFSKELDMDNGLKYQAIKDKKIDVMTVFTTDGQLTSSDIVVLEDDKKMFPSYMAGTVIRDEILKKYPELSEVLKQLNNVLDDKTMAKLNYEVESNNKKPEDVARQFLKNKNLIGEK